MESSVGAVQFQFSVETSVTWFSVLFLIVGIDQPFNISLQPDQILADLVAVTDMAGKRKSQEGTKGAAKAKAIKQERSDGSGEGGKPVPVFVNVFTDWLFLGCKQAS